MDYKIIEIFAKVGGLAGLGLGLFWLIAKDIIPDASEEFQLSILYGAIGLGLASIVAWLMKAMKPRQGLHVKGDGNTTSQTMQGSKKGEQKATVKGNNNSYNQVQ